MKNLTKDKRGVAGLDLSKSVIVALLILVVLVFVTLVLVSTLRPIGDSLGGVSAVTVKTNESFTSVVSNTKRYFTVQNLYGVSCTITSVLNATDGTVIAAGNYSAVTTYGGCGFTPSPSSGSNNTDWMVSYTYTTRDSNINDIGNNITEGYTGFFGNTGIWFAILSVVIIILLISVVILAITGWEGRNKSSPM